MRRGIILVALCVFGIGEASASLVARSGNLVYDTERNITWIANFNLFQTQAQLNPNLVSQVISALPVVTVGGSAYSGLVRTFEDYPSHGGSYVRNSDGSLYLVLDAGNFDVATGNMTWWGAKAWVDQLNYAGFDDWRLPAVSQCDTRTNCSSGELGHLFYTDLGGVAGADIQSTHNSNYNLFSNFQPYGFWSSTEYDASLAAGFGTNALTQGTYDKYAMYFHALAVRDGDVGSVPEPSGMWLVAAGLVAAPLARRAARSRLNKEIGRRKL